MKAAAHAVRSARTAGLGLDPNSQRRAARTPDPTMATRLGLHQMISRFGMRPPAAQRLDVGNATMNRLMKVDRQAAPTARTRASAVALVPAHVVPKVCLVWFENRRAGWSPIPGTGCAHWVSHQLGFQTGLTCAAGYSVRVQDVIEGKQEIVLRDVVVGDLWKNPTAHSHVGIVRAVQVAEHSEEVTSVTVEHDSSRAGRVTTSRFTTGKFYR